MFRVLLAVVVIGLLVAYKGLTELRLSSSASSTPTMMSCTELETTGCDKNAHIVLTDFLFSDQLIYETKSRTNDAWKCVYVPIVPTDGEFAEALVEQIRKNGGQMPESIPTPSSFKVLVKSTKVSGEHELSLLTEQETLQGMVINEVESLGSKEKELLQQAYPGVDVSSCYIIEHGRAPSGIFGSLGLLAVGMTVSGLGGFGMYRGVRSNQ